MRSIGGFETPTMIIPWFPWLEMLCICAGISGFAILGGLWLGPLGIPLGALVGLFIGRWSVNLPLVLWASWSVDWLHARSTEELQALFVENRGFRGPATYQLAVEIMKERGEDIRPVLPAILDLMGSKRQTTRLEAHAAFLAGFPELVSKLEDYRSEDPADVCRAKISSLRSALVRRDSGS
jgi:hypothetical protein